eukprot:scaffold2021_cov176-Amphora_coffeaeformis.AAC.7
MYHNAITHLTKIGAGRVGDGQLKRVTVGYQIDTVVKVATTTTSAAFVFIPGCFNQALKGEDREKKEREGRHHRHR